MKVLGPIYGQQNVRVSARAQINMEKLVRESTTYNTPEKIDDEDKTGIVKTEETTMRGQAAVTQQAVLRAQKPMLILPSMILMERRMEQMHIVKVHPENTW